MALEWQRKDKKRVGCCFQICCLWGDRRGCLYGGGLEEEIEKDEGRRVLFPPLCCDSRFLGDCLEETLVS